MAELRRKSFDDLHYIWYEVLKERNVIGREIRLAQGIQYDGINKHIEIDTDLSLVQKRIKVVLLERQTAYERAQLMQEKQVAYLQEFKERYLSNEEGEDIIEKLERLQYAIFGIPADLQDIDLDHDINVKFIEGVQYISDLKFSQYLQEHAGSLPEVLSNRESLESIIEQLPFLLKSGEEATQEVITMRENNVSTKIDKIDVIPFLKQAIGNFIDERIADEE